MLGVLVIDRCPRQPKLAKGLKHQAQTVRASLIKDPQAMTIGLVLGRHEPECCLSERRESATRVHCGPVASVGIRKIAPAIGRSCHPRYASPYGLPGTGSGPFL